MADLTVLYDTAPRVIAALRAAGVPLGIVSTKYRYLHRAYHGAGSAVCKHF